MKNKKEYFILPPSKTPLWRRSPEYFIIFILLIISFLTLNAKIVFADDPTGAAAWTMKLFAGPGKGDESITTVTASDGITGGPNKIYALGSRFVPPDGRDRVLYEFVWAENTWIRTETTIPSASFFDIPKNLRFYDLRREGRKRLYFSTWHGAVFEYSYTGATWNMDTYLRNSEESEIYLYGYNVGSRGTNDDLKIYRSSRDYQLEEYSWNGTNWEMINFQNIYKVDALYPSIDHIGFGSSRQDDKNYMYILGVRASSCPVIELEWSPVQWQEDDGSGNLITKGPGWKESSRIPNIGSFTTLNPVQLFTADIGNGLKLYVIAGQGGSNCTIYECESVPNIGTSLSSAIDNSAAIIPVVSTADFSQSGNIKIEGEIITYASVTPTSFTGCTRGTFNSVPAVHSAGKMIFDAFYINRWKRVNKISLDGSVVGITYGKISWEDTDPVALYALITNNNTGDFSIENADEVHEYTFDKTANRGRGAWKRTWKVKLFEENMQQFHSVKGFPTSDFCMTNGRNEIVIDADGKRIDKYQRLYIVDTWGNIWECSIPPRSLRPEYKAEQVPTTKPTITGE